MTQFYSPIMTNDKSSMSFHNLFLNKRLSFVFLLGFSSGLPLALTYSTLQAWFTDAGVALTTIGALSLIRFPYLFKFLWAPLMDAFNLPFGSQRLNWVIIAQLLVAASLAILAFMDPSRAGGFMAATAVMVAFFAASQDIAIDAYRTIILQPEERGLGVSYFVLAYRIAMLVSGGLALIFADKMGWRAAYLCMSGLMFLSVAASFYAPKINGEVQTSGAFFNTCKNALRDLARHEAIGLLLLLIVLYKFGDALALSLMTTFLLKGLSFSLTEVGVAFKILSPIAIIVGGLLGGTILLRMNLYRALIIFGLLQAFSNLSFAMLVMLPKNFWLMSAAVSLENFCSGLSTSALLALLMSLCCKEYSATQYAILSALASLSAVLLGPFASFLVLNVGWTQFFVWSFVLCFPSILLLFYLKEKVSPYAAATADS